LQIYYKSVGRGSCLDLGIAPNREGKLSYYDALRLTEFGTLLKNTFSLNLAGGASLIPSNVRGRNFKKFGPKYLLDKDRYSYWATDDNIKTPNLIIDLHVDKKFDIIKLRENIKLGQRIEEFAVDAFIDGKWQQIAAGTSVGANRIIRLKSDIIANKVRLRITKSPVCIALSEFGLYEEAKRNDVQYQLDNIIPG